MPHVHHCVHRLIYCWEHSCVYCCMLSVHYLIHFIVFTLWHTKMSCQVHGYSVCGDACVCVCVCVYTCCTLVLVHTWQTCRVHVEAHHSLLHVDVCTEIVPLWQVSVSFFKAHSFVEIYILYTPSHNFICQSLIIKKKSYCTHCYIFETELIIPIPESVLDKDACKQQAFHTGKPLWTVEMCLCQVWLKLWNFSRCIQMVIQM